METTKNILLLLLSLGFAYLLINICIAIINTALIKRKYSTYKPARDRDKKELYANKLSEMVKCQTVSSLKQEDLSEFYKLHNVLEKQFPLLHTNMEKHDVDGSLLFKWQGKSSDKPIMLMSHMDVVEASGQWEHEPFSGDIGDGRIWGRGTCDTKSSLMAFLQACEELIEQGFIPEQDVYLASSRTEETSDYGASKIIEYLNNSNIKINRLWDEGGALTSNPIPGVNGYFAMVGVFEKGSACIRFNAKGSGGHSSSPSKNSPIARLAKFVVDIEKRSPFKAKISPELQEMFTRLAPYCSFPLRLVFSNIWLFKPIIINLLPALSPSAAAMLKTTIAFTMQSGSMAQNVIPQTASLTCNLRYMPHQQQDESLAVLNKLAKKYNLETELIFSNNPSKSLNLNGEAFSITQKAIESCFAGSACVPYIVTGATDARHYDNVANECVRFAPILYDPQQLKSMHGLNENLYTKALVDAVEFYKFIIKTQ